MPVFEHFLESLFGPLLNAAVETWTISRHFQFESRALFEMCKGLGLAGEMQDDGNMGDGRRRLSLVELVTSVLKLGKHPRLKTDSGSPKRPNKIPNCWLMKHGNPRYGKYGIENSQRVGYHAPLHSTCLFPLFWIFSCLYIGTSWSTERHPQGSRGELKIGPNSHFSKSWIGFKPNSILGPRGVKIDRKSTEEKSTKRRTKLTENGLVLRKHSY